MNHTELNPFWHTVITIVSVIGSIMAMTHLLLRHRDYRSAAFWTTLIVFEPLFTPLLYLFLGINILRRRARSYRNSVNALWREPVSTHPLPFSGDSCAAQEHQQLARTLDRISRFSITHGNHFEILRNGDNAMPQMLHAISQATQSISLASYIFEAIGIGSEFIVALSGAVKRGVQVRVMIDDAGTRYSRPSVTTALEEAGVAVRRFMPSHFFLRLVTMNLRNHRKIMVVDGILAFTGGMNIREGNMILRQPKHPVRDLHFKVTGPVVAQIQRVFAEDWSFCTGEELEGPIWFPELPAAGTTSAIGIVDGPDEDLEVMPATFFAALNAAREEVNIVTPYFLPTVPIIAALRLCAIRGVKVNIITPSANNIPIVSWAAQTMYPELLDVGCRIFESPSPFDHSKFFLIDGVWSFLGSTNWDPRSLRLNFEFNLACHDPELARGFRTEWDQKLSESREITLDKLESTPVWHRLRNGIARLFIPFL